MEYRSKTYLGTYLLISHMRDQGFRAEFHSLTGSGEFDSLGTRPPVVHDLVDPWKTLPKARLILTLGML